MLQMLSISVALITATGGDLERIPTERVKAEVKALDDAFLGAAASRHAARAELKRIDVQLGALATVNSFDTLDKTLEKPLPKETEKLLRKRTIMAAITELEDAKREASLLDQTLTKATFISGVMTGSSAVLPTTWELLDLETSWTVETSPWAIPEFVHGYDQARALWSTVGGAVSAVAPIALSVAALAQDQAVLGDAAPWVALGASVVGGGSFVVGNVATDGGAQDANFAKVKETIETGKRIVTVVEFSRQAYDEVKQRKALIKPWKQEADDFQQRLTSFNGQAAPTSASPPEEKIKYISAVHGFLADYERIMGRIPEYLASFGSLADSELYKRADKNTQDRIDAFVKQAQTANTQYSGDGGAGTVRAHLRVFADLVTRLLAAQT